MRPRLLSLESMVLPAVLQSRFGVQEAGSRRLVSHLPDRLGARASVGRRPALRTVRDASHQTRFGAMVPAHHEVCRRTVGLLEDALARARAGDADQLDWTQRGRGDHLQVRARRRDSLLQHAPRHVVWRDVLGISARTSIGREVDNARPQSRRGSVRAASATSDGH